MSEVGAPEARARALIDQQLAQAGWDVQDRAQINLVNHRGVAVRETIMALGAGRADYLLYLDKKPVGVIEAKPTGTTLTAVEWQSRPHPSGLRDVECAAAESYCGQCPFLLRYLADSNCRCFMALTEEFSVEAVSFWDVAGSRVGSTLDIQFCPAKLENNCATIEGD